MRVAASDRMRGWALVAALGLAGCASSDDVGADSASVILGENDLVRVDPAGSNVPAKFRRVIDAIGRTSPMGCTVTHLGDGLAITAGHCFRDPQPRADGLPCVTKHGSSVTVEWGVRGDLDAQGYLVSNCTQILALAFDLQGADYAIIAVDPAPPAYAGVTFEHPDAGRMLTLFSHPQRRPLEWSGTCPAGELRYPQVVKHSCDSEPSSSGAPVLDDARATIIAIHNGGIAGEYNYATPVVDTPLADFIGGAPTPPTPVDDPPAQPAPPPTPADGGNVVYFSEVVTGGQWLDGWYFDVSGSIRVTLTGTGDVDLYVRRGASPTSSTFDCRPYVTGSNETCSFTGPGRYFVGLAGDAPMSEVGVEVNYD
ncbi:MAG: pre-peptidase C-terminal domain-containing protein [Deltaproteobacteria bacterium]|nr:pre-peptidase C-terminal domain-containing protein [Deltaproteobacteria bacterium]